MIYTTAHVNEVSCNFFLVPEPFAPTPPVDSPQVLGLAMAVLWVSSDRGGGA